MKTFFRTFIFILLISRTGYGQQEKAQDSLRNKLTVAAMEIMTDAGICTLITLDEEGRPRARVMDAFLPDNDFVVWFGTNPKSRKVTQIGNDPRVSLLYLDPDNSGYVMIQGEAQLINDDGEKEKRWKEGWEAFYPDKKESFILIKVIPEWMEVISISRGITSDPTTWTPDIVWFDR